MLQLPTDGVVHEGVTAGVPPGGGREAGEEEGGKEGNSGFSVVTFIVETLAQIYFCKTDKRLNGLDCIWVASGRSI